MKQRRNDAEEGFTLIELMVVVLILGILMAIAIPTFLSLTNNAKKTAAQADLTTAITDVATYFTTNGTYGNGIKNVVQNFEGTDANLNWMAFSGGRVVRIPPPLEATASLRQPVQVALPAQDLTGGAAAGVKEILVGFVSRDGAQVRLGVLDKNGDYYWAQDTRGTVTYANPTKIPRVPRSYKLHSLP